jgi:serine protease
MRNILASFLLTIIIYSGPAFSKDNQQNLSNSPNVVPNMVVFKYKKNVKANNHNLAVDSKVLLSSVSISRIVPVVNNNAVFSQTSVRLQDINYLFYDGNVSPNEVVSELSLNNNIEYAEPVYLANINAIPNDSLFIQQDYMETIKATQAWDVVKSEGSDVVIAIVDGGTDINHPDLKNNLWTNEDEIPNNGIDDDNNGFVDDVNGWNFANNSNDPTGLPSTPINAAHGTQTAGLACAVTNNKSGIAGVSWNAKLLPLNVSYTNDNELLYGFYNFEGKPGGILYAAQNGADIISCSWGSLGGYSLFQQDIVNAVTEMGSIIVAASGNNNSTASHYPSSYKNVLSVTGTNMSDKKISFSNYGYDIDLTAPGFGVFTTSNNSNYTYASGTSFSNPIVAGVMALVKSQNPELTGLQLAHQVRVTADNIENLNPGYKDQLGTGRVNAYRAVTETNLPSIRLENVEFVDENENGIIEQGEQVEVYITVKNYLAPVSNISLTLEEDDSAILLGTRNISLSAIGTLQEINVENPFRFIVNSSAPSGHTVQFKLRINSGNYSDFDSFQLTIMPLFGDISVNNIATTVSSVGRIGFADDGDNQEGLGFKFNDGNNLLFEGAIITGTGADNIISSARGAMSDDQIIYDRDFARIDGFELKINTPGDQSDQESIALFNDAEAINPLNIQITQHTFAFISSPDDDYILVKFIIENLNASPMSDFYFGLFFDWDMDAEFYATNKAAYDAARKLGYAFDSGGGPTTYVGSSILGNSTPHFKAIFNDQEIDPSGWGIYDGFTDAEKWQAISGGTTFVEAGPADISYTIASGPHNIEAKQNLDIVFALAAGENLQDLQTNIDAAKKRWEELITSGVDNSLNPNLPAVFALEQNYPNPFNPRTVINYRLARKENVVVKIYNISGQHVKTLVETNQAAGLYTIEWDGTNDKGHSITSGTYLYEIIAGDFQQVKKMVLLR